MRKLLFLITLLTLTVNSFANDSCKIVQIYNTNEEINGYIKIYPEKYKCGDIITVEAIPNSGYKFFYFKITYPISSINENIRRYYYENPIQIKAEDSVKIKAIYKEQHVKLDTIIIDNTKAIKYVEKGVVIIEKDGVRYNAQGVKLTDD